ncbi:hypothetical protein ACFY9Q_08840 [Streptomyces sp. NPDC012389]|uniref:hypothetical protein n=1 Tax=Streptomyces sp. NPDC012389 TaxID=3364830 RepID=UPI0036E0F295
MMSLASAGRTGGDGGRSTPDLKASRGPWTTAAGVAGSLHTSTASGLTELGTAAAGVSEGADGFSSTAALTEVLTSWQERLTSVRNECSRLKGALNSAAQEFGEQEIRAQQAFSGVRTK